MRRMFLCLRGRQKKVKRKDLSLEMRDEDHDRVCRV